MIAIPNMEKPKDCNSCRFLEGDAMDGLCHAMNLWLDDESLRWYAYEEDDIDDSKPLDCPLIEIDEKAFNEVIKGYLEGLKAIQNGERTSNDTD